MCQWDVLTHAKDVTIEMNPFCAVLIKLENKNAKTRWRKGAKIE